MKYVILVPDGMSGEPLESLNDCTCMEAAHTPHMDMIARGGQCGMVNNIPRGMTPASDVANLSILGYDPKKYYCGRGPLEAANLGVELDSRDVAFRFNLVTVSNDIMVDYSAGHITTNETSVLVEMLNKEFGNDKFHFHTGTSYRNLLVVRSQFPEEADKLIKVKCFPPHDILDRSILRYIPKNAEIAELMEHSKNILENCDINKVRIDLGQNPANMIWIWGQGKKPDMPKFFDAYGVSGGMISAVDLLKGMGRVLGLEIAEVPGATGYYDTNYEGKALAALDMLERRDMVFVHVEAPDEAGHNGDAIEKVRAIENFDSKITGKIIKELSKRGKYRVLILPDHPTPVKKRTHTSDQVPVAMCGEGIKADEVMVFSEKSAKEGNLTVKNGWELMKVFLKENI